MGVILSISIRVKPSCRRYLSTIAAGCSIAMRKSSRRLSASKSAKVGLSELDQLHEYPITDMPRWRRKRILNLLANMSEDGVPAFVSFDLDNVALSQLEQFNEELELAMMVENKYELELDEEG